MGHQINEDEIAAVRTMLEAAALDRPVAGAKADA
jgi:hypothetical protein